ncbi:gluconokinase [Deinococcus sp. Marseille-Q6407]|uniref:gluconokinase n=1 Tax=Deinococcus sp. Marseille-Q6407 TaxID=2969223 RepID=UPI0021C13FA4|nr:gluconokinase [Deinococcus sp. Marseille-Q6407]
MKHLVIMGVSGSGKSTLAAELQRQLGWPFAEADEFHPQANIDKMSRGEALTDRDRWPWLEALRDWMSRQDRAGQPSLVTCSALKRSYRDLLRGAEGEVVFALLHGDRDLLSQRLQRRKGHFMPPSLLDSQLSTLELPAPDEAGVLTLDITRTPAELTRQLLTLLQQGDN